jgi:chromosome segregation ATPase
MSDASRTEGGGESRLDRRRGKVQAAKAAADAAQVRVTALDGRLAANAAEAQEHKTALRRLRGEVNRLKEALKVSDKQREQLRAARKKAEAGAAKAQRRSQAADHKYDEVVLAELVRRERDRDLAAASQAQTAGGVTPAATTSETAPEQPSEAATTAIGTAAGATAAGTPGDSSGATRGNASNDGPADVPSTKA